MTGLQKLLSGFGILPFAPLKIAKVGGALNIMTSIGLGKDIKNGFSGDITASEPELLSGTKRLDWIKRFRELGPAAPGEGFARFGLVLRAIGLHARSSLTTFAGAQRAVMPYVVGEIAFQAGKQLKLNNTLPVAVRRWFRFT